MLGIKEFRSDEYPFTKPEEKNAIKESEIVII